MATSPSARTCSTHGHSPKAGLSPSSSARVNEMETPCPCVPRSPSKRENVCTMISSGSATSAARYRASANLMISPAWTPCRSSPPCDPSANHVSPTLRR
eukprot:5513042-Pyramimonas_sp.AAC.2